MASLALVRAYQQSFASHPYFTLAVTNGALNAFGDAVAQVTQKLVRISVLSLTRGDVNLTPRSFQTDPDNGRRKRQYDLLRTLRFFAFGFGMGEFACPVMHELHVKAAVRQAHSSVAGTSSSSATFLCGP
ncbi:hypothetical protein GSI_08227 [Ganoderma sinense ZZ0214-1]|uniref:Uncharacterized protein n=1 Tax=Ganoderma sinense ZZ0214-1 TaxID=1077348 RepID=A0A2G8S758_9APHY|nr:hypothetical protein GSI_08227 [Ganoderma sinense ZZ0214-1]